MTAEKAGLWLVYLLRFCAILTGSAVVAVFLPRSLMNEIHRLLTLGDLPEKPIVDYLARSLSAFYAMLGGLLWVLSTDVRRYRTPLLYLSWTGLLFAALLIGIDITFGLPLFWICGEGFSVTTLSTAMLLLTRRIEGNISSEKTSLLKQLERSMYGHNYCVCLGLQKLKRTDSLEDTKMELKKKYKNANVEDLKISTLDDFWKEIQHALDYRGDSDAGLKLDLHREKALKGLQEQYTELIKQHIDDKTIIYAMLSSTDIPGYPVFWDYRYILLNQTIDSLFIYGSASD